MKFLSIEVALYLYKSTISMHGILLSDVWAGAPSCYLELLDKLQKWICRTVHPPLAISNEPLAHHRNLASLSLFYRYYLGRCSSELAQLVPFTYTRGRSTCYSDCMIFQSPFLDVRRMSLCMTTASFPAELGSEILCL